MAKNENPVLGMIDCPHCGEVGGMAVKHDKNGEPFGHCEDCAGQLRVGGKPGRVRKFVKRYPWAAGAPVLQPWTGEPGTSVTEKKMPEIPVTVTVTEPVKTVGAAEVSSAPPPKKKQAAWTDVLASFATIGKVEGATA